MEAKLAEPEPVALLVRDRDGEWECIEAWFACWRCGEVLRDGFADVRDRHDFLVRVCPGCVTDADVLTPGVALTTLRRAD